MAFTTANLLSSIGRRSFMPVNQLTYSEAEILSLADEVTKTHILPNINGIREEYYVTYKDTAIVANQAAYPIHARAFGMIVREVHIIDAAGNVVSNLPRIEPEEVTSYVAGAVNNFYLRGDNIVLDRPPAVASNSIRQFFFLRPGDLVLVEDAAVISSIDTGANSVTVSTIPSDWVTGDIFDFIKKDGAHGYRSIDNTSTNIASTTITFSSLPSDLAVGDYVSVSGTSPLIQMPPEYQPVLAQLVAAEILESMNQPGAAKAKEKANELLVIAQKAITPRVVGEDRTIANQNWW